MTEFKPGRRALLLGALALVAGAGACTRRGDAGPSSLLKDLRDRPLAITPPVGKLSIDDSRFLIALSLIHPDPVSLLAAWASVGPESRETRATCGCAPRTASTLKAEAELGVFGKVASAGDFSR